MTSIPIRRSIVPLLLLLLTVSGSLVSCASREKLIYFNQPSSDSTSTALQTVYNPVFKPGDLLEIIVTTSNKEAAELMNLPQRPISNTGFQIGSPALGGYLVSTSGSVDLPMIGGVSVAGKTREQVSAALIAAYAEYVAQPLVQIRIINFKITVLGDVVAPGTFSIPNERITLLEALGIAGDLNITGNRKNILVIREVNGVKTETRIDLTTKDVFSSPVYYLNQNDVVYVEPNRVKMSSSQYSPIYSVFVAVTSLIVTTVSVITRP